MGTLFQTIFDSAPDAIIVSNQDGEIIMSNKQAKQLFGYDEVSFKSIEIEALIPGRYGDIHKKYRSTYNENPHPREMGKGLELIAKRKDGSEFFVEISLSPVEIGNTLYVSAAIRDVSEKKEIANQLKAQQKFCSAQNSRLLNFAYIVTHNLNSHATNLGMMLNFFEQAKTLKEKTDILSHLKAISDGLSETIKHLNEVASLQTDINGNTEIINLRSYVAKTIEILMAEINAKQGVVDNQIGSDVTLAYNPAYMESILLNVISNGIKYSHPDRRPEISLKTHSDQNRLVLEIQDNGLGIDLKKHGRQLFGLHRTFHGNKDARGIGLFITKNQIEALGGKVDVDSKVNEGTTFKITF